MMTPRVSRILSIFSFCTRRWVPTPPGLPTVKQHVNSLSLTTWNIDAFSPRPVARASAIINRLLTEPSTTRDIIFLQEVSREVRAYLLRDALIRAGFFVTDAEDDNAFHGVPFATMTLLTKACFESFISNNDAIATPVTRFKFPSKYARDALCIDICLPLPKSRDLASMQQQHPQRLRLVNVHLDSLASTLHYRKEQMHIARNLLHATDVQQESKKRSLGLIAGDFNAISQDDEELIAKNRLVDAWVQLHDDDVAKSDGCTWGLEKRSNNLMPRRLDRIALTEGLEPIDMHIIRSGSIAMPKPGEEKDAEVRWSDHAGLNCRFRIA